MQEMKLVFVGDNWRPDSPEVEKEGDIYQRLERADVPYIAPFDVGNNIRNSTTLLQKYREQLWVGGTEIPGIALYRISLDKPAHNLVKFRSTYEFARAVSHAMTAHDAAYFEANMLHRDVNARNILTDDEGNGFLVDWDICIRINDDIPSACRSQRGTWQFMSAALLRDPQRIQTIEDDRESAVLVLTWLALRYTKHDKLSKMASYLFCYDEVDPKHSMDESSTGGRAKGNQFFGNLPLFNSDPLNRLLTVLRKPFSARYSNERYSAEEIQLARDYVAGGLVDRDATTLLGHLDAYIYGSRMDSLKKPNWLVEAFNEHLQCNDWPLGDKAEANSLVPATFTSQQRTSQQAALEERAQGSNSKQRMG